MRPGTMSRIDFHWSLPACRRWNLGFMAHWLLTRVSVTRRISGPVPLTVLGVVYSVLKGSIAL